MNLEIDRRTQFRSDTLSRFGADESVKEELLRYSIVQFKLPNLRPEDFPFPDEPFIPAWREYAEMVASAGSLQPLVDVLVQLRFPVRAGMSAEPEYIAATKTGRYECAPSGAAWKGNSTLQIHPTAAGHIPVVTMFDRSDFERVVQALTRRNEPVPIPASMGATMVAGYNNWDRVHRAKMEFLSAGGGDWTAEFARFKTQKERYQDKFILLSAGPYSGVAAGCLDLDAEEWAELSIWIRREHECAHYFTKRVFGSMQNNLMDELIADFTGITSAAGRFHKSWLLWFLGLERFPDFRQGARLENYKGTPQLSDPAFRILQCLVNRAADNLEIFDETRRELRLSGASPEVFFALASLTLEEVACPEGGWMLCEALQRSTNVIATRAAEACA